MCGLGGFVAAPAEFAAFGAASAVAMAMAIASRGPDDCGAWSDAGSGVALAHRRLSVVDLSQAGHQPMHSASGRWVIIFNGEIYNHTALRTQIEQQPWRGHSDTETLLAGFDRWGVRATIERSVGMFAFAAWDRQAHRLVTHLRIGALELLDAATR